MILRRGGCTTNWARRGSNNRRKVALNSSRVTIRICSKTSSHSKVVGQPKARVRLEDKVALISDQCLEEVVVVVPSIRSSMCFLEVKADRKEEVPAKDSKVKDSSSNHHHRNHQHPIRKTYSE